ncbi:hypothetical protein [Terasakiella pusilla]|uniref:hypothetical protein n=1 Tax=Terasakiella pusilla TaxID=64973 RepID=UPI0004909732|nr:hypothetical protein [Terasakiella pusilla]
MKPVPSHTLSCAVAVLFACWIIWLWVTPEQVEERVQEDQATEQVQVKPADAAPSVPTPEQVSFVLPAPPAVQVVAPAPQPQPTPEPEVVKAAPVQQPAAQSVAPKVAARVEPVKLEKTLPPQPTPTNVKPQPTKEKPIEVPPALEVTVAQTAGGRALLRVLEHGKGPLIEIAWPKEERAREALHQIFKACFGMENAVMDAKGDLYRTSEARGQRWEINLDRYSGFLREASGSLPRSEQGIRQVVKRHHGGLGAAGLVRIFPRKVDASLLGGLQAMVGPQYMQARSIQARYVQVNGQVLVRDIFVDGVAREGVIALSPTRRCRGRA